MRTLDDENTSRREQFMMSTGYPDDAELREWLQPLVDKGVPRTYLGRSPFMHPVSDGWVCAL